MAGNYSGGTTKNEIESFSAHLSYRNLTSFYLDNMFDTRINHINYGLYNSKHQLVVPNIGDNFQNLKTFGEDGLEGVRALPFVVRAFGDFRKSFLERLSRLTMTSPAYLNDIKALKGHEDFDQLYEEYKKRRATAINKELLNLKQTSPATLGEDRANIISLENIKNFPITRSGFLLSTHCPISVSGLVVEVAELEYQIDQYKADIISSPMFECYMAAAYATGFRLDRNAPWRLIADLQSTSMISQIRKYNQDTTSENILDRFFRRKVQFDDIKDLNSLRISGYNIKYKSKRNIYSNLIFLRMKELDIKDSEFDFYNERINVLLDQYSRYYPEGTEQPALSIIGEMCSDKISEIVSKKRRSKTTGPLRIRDVF